ncbi:PREDICTED: structural maintenance of chromosomes protein 1A-like [Cyphomyrmex costatus]|uniref:structural maintenance of chromosomes protein 1A-like n=1 Tax=Cyphomyrmex costatus TaxID=456900 RepID=UPI00085239F2|nr:PREDICTED: structural maintenance of chromosomes protein 1A-like [Cyphomyrmex costatus]
MEKAETEKYLKLEEQREKVEFLQEKERKIKPRIDQYLQDKKVVIISLENAKSQFKSLSNSLEDIEQQILKTKNIIEQKKTEHIAFEDDTLYWQKKRDCARMSLDNANKALDTKKRNIQELNNELERIDNKLTELRQESQTSAIELSNSQVKRYMELMNKVECQAEVSVKQIKSLMRNQQEDHDKLGNENRRKEELEDKEKQIRLKKCVSLDGYFYHKNGLMSGGQADLIVKAKQWDEQRILILKEQKAQLMRELRDLPKISLMQSEFDTINIEINALILRNKYTETDIKVTENKIVETQKELDMVNGEIIALNKKTKQMELEQQYNRIENQLCFENENDIESKVLKWQRAVEHADAEWNKVYQQGHAKIKVNELEETEMSKLKDNYTNVAKDLEDVNKKLAEHKSKISVIEELYLDSQKMEDIIIPMLETHCGLEESVSTGSLSTSIESSEDCEILTKIDFSQFPEKISNFTKKELQDMVIKLNEEITEIENELEDLINHKIDEKIDIIAQRMQKVNTNLRNYRKKYNGIITQFESVKAKRYKSFSDCLERVTAEIDVIYKNLVNNTSAQAIILPDNPEEPYAGNIIYNCRAPYKGFQPLLYLSEGEKSMASLALLFAIQRYKQVPFFIMDEGDAALDKANIKNVVSFIRFQKTSMQFIVVSLCKELYRNADALIGVTFEVS